MTLGLGPHTTRVFQSPYRESVLSDGAVGLAIGHTAFRLLPLLATRR